MKYIALSLRIIIMIIGIYMIVSNPYGTPPFVSGFGFLTIGVYLAMVAIFGTQIGICPFIKEKK